MGLGVIFGAIRMFAGGVFERGLKALSALAEFLLDDLWRALALVMIAAYSWAAFVTLPAAREEAEAARADAAENYDGWKAEAAAHAQSIENIRAASAVAMAQARDNAARVEAEQRAINERNARDFQTRLGDLRRRYDALVRLREGSEAADQRAGAGGAHAAGVPGAPALPARSDEASGNPRLPQPAIQPACPADRVCLTLEEAWIASVQALQLDALIDTIEQRHAASREPEAPDAKP